MTSKLVSLVALGLSATLSLGDDSFFQSSEVTVGDRVFQIMKADEGEKDTNANKQYRYTNYMGYPYTIKTTKGQLEEMPVFKTLQWFGDFRLDLG